MQSCHVLESDKQECELTSHLEHISASFLSICNFLYLITCPFIQWPQELHSNESHVPQKENNKQNINNNKYPQNFWAIECEQCNFRSNQKSHIWLLSGYLNTFLVTHINIEVSCASLKCYFINIIYKVSLKSHLYRVLLCFILTCPENFLYTLKSWLLLLRSLW